MSTLSVAISCLILCFISKIIKFHHKPVYTGAKQSLENQSILD